MAIFKAKFIKAEKAFISDSCAYAPLFRKRFFLPDEVQSAKLYACGLGYGYYYINGKSVSPDLFTAPVSNYQKTVWYNTYDVTALLQQGENVVAAECGNGWYNEAVASYWKQNEMPGRDMPKLRLALEVNGEVVLVSDQSFKCKNHDAVTFNQLRIGESFDARQYEKDWNTLEYNDKDWAYALIDETPPKGVMRECLCEPIREFEEIAPVAIVEKDENCYLFDFGKNMSGYARIKVKQQAGDVITLKYFEELDGEGNIHDTGFDEHYPENEFQTDTFVCSDEELIRSPRFTYHGFRYIYARGLKKVNQETLTAVFVHQAIEVRTSFTCSDERLNKLFEAGIQSTFSNMFYMPTDCPTREKYGWYNDAQSSAEQFLTDFKSERVLIKWWQDICDTMLETGILPGAMPEYNTSYDWGNGPVSEGVLFEIPYRIYLHTGDDSLLQEGIPFFEKNIGMLKNKFEKDGTIDYGLWDWASPIPEESVGAVFVNEVLLIKFLRILKLAKERKGEEISLTEQDIAFFTQHCMEQYLNEKGECVIPMQSAVAMLIYFDLYQDPEPLKAQLKRLVEEANFHHNCGMVGLRYLYPALNKCGLYEYAYKILTAKGFPSYMDWLEHGATTLYEMWNIQADGSRNHHMYSSFMTWLVKTAGGIRRYQDTPGYQKTEVNPYFFTELNYAKVCSDTVNGKISVFWQRTEEGIILEIDVPEGMTVYHQGKILEPGINIITIKENKTEVA